MVQRPRSRQERPKEVLRGSIALARDAESVWSYIRDFGHYPEWFPSIVEMRSLDDLPAGSVGKRYRETAILPGGKEEAIKVEVIVSDDERRHLAMHASLAPVLPRFDYRVISEGNGASRLDWLCTGRARGPYAALGRAIMAVVLRPRLRVALGNLKRILEADFHQNMRSARVYRFGPPAAANIIFASEARPTPGKGEVLVRQMASSVNQIDCHRRQGYGRVVMRLRGALNFPLILGNDISGRVVSVGPGVTAFKPEDAVFGVKAPSSAGTFADLVATKAECLVSKPASISFEEAAAMPYTFLTAWNALVVDGGLTEANAPSRRVFVQGGGGGVGSMAVQIARAWGAHVAASCGPDQVETVRQLGADVVVDYTREVLVDRLQDYDLVLCAANDAEQDALIAILKSGSDARYVTIIHPTLALTDELGLVKGLVAAKRKLRALNRRLCPDGKRAAWSLFKPSREGLGALRAMAAAGKVRPIVDSVVPLELIAEAQERVESGRAAGKVVVAISNDDDWSPERWAA